MKLILVPFQLGLLCLTAWAIAIWIAIALPWYAIGLMVSVLGLLWILIGGLTIESWRAG